jgi:glycosyl transferase family 25
MKGYLINLKKRPDRLENFNTDVKKFLPDVKIEIVEAIDGSILDLTDINLKNSVNPWNYTNLPEKVLRGVIGCCQSHLKCYKKIFESADKYAIIFEDDCYFIKDKENYANDFLKNLPIPEKFGIIWLNEWSNSVDLTYSNEHYELVNGGTKTTEGYIISRDFAKILYDEIIGNIGAIDAHISQVYFKYSRYPSYNIKSNLFIQRDRKDSDIR